MRLLLFLLLCLMALPAYADFRFVHVTDSHVGAGTNAATDTEMSQEMSDGSRGPTPHRGRFLQILCD